MKHHYKSLFLVIFSVHTTLPHMSSLSIKNDINRTEIALTGGFTQAFESKNLITFPPTAENFNKWQQGMAAAQKLVAREAQSLAQFVDPLIDVNRVLNQTFIKLRDYAAKVGNSAYNSGTITGILKSLKDAQASLTKIKNSFEKYQKTKTSRFEKMKNALKKITKKDTGSDVKESDFYPIVTRIIMSLDILIDRILNKDFNNI